MQTNMNSQDAKPFDTIDELTIRVANALFDNKVDGRIHRPVFVGILRDRCNMDETKADKIYSEIDKRRSGVVQYEDVAQYLHTHPSDRDDIASELDFDDTGIRSRSQTSLQQLLAAKRGTSSWSSYNLLNLDPLQQQQQALMGSLRMAQAQQQGVSPARGDASGARASSSPPEAGPSGRPIPQMPNYFGGPGGIAGVPAGMPGYGGIEQLSFGTIPVQGTGGGGTIYQNPLLHGSTFGSGGYVMHPMASPRGYGLDPRFQDLAAPPRGRSGPVPARHGASRTRTRGSVSGALGADETDSGSLRSTDNSDNEFEADADAAAAAAAAAADEMKLEQEDGAQAQGAGDEEEPEQVDFETWVRYHHGARPIHRLLIANNGISAVKSIRCMRQWLYETFGDSNLIHFVSMATPEDMASNAEYIRLADEVVPVPGGANNYNYANVPLVVNIAKQTKCDAVWPGWGHASENPALPRMLKENGIMWVGPDADSMYASGDKIMSTLIAQSAGVPCIPWSGDSIRVKYRKSNPREIEGKFKLACIKNAKEAMKHAKRIGFPVMIKASEGGGGKGIRMCHSEDELESLYHQVTSEVPGSPIFVMKLAKNARHLEVQLLGDHFGNVIAVFSRDCSIQRRCQKIIEEGPVPNVDPKLLLEMENAAVALGKAISYFNCGTVEFLYDNDAKEVYFLEVNPRLQVEHPVSELISGVNLPAAQLQVAMGIPLYCIADIRRMYNEDPTAIDPFLLEPSKRVRPVCHAIACRITAENPSNKFRPTSGQISELLFRSTPNVWGYFSLKQSGRIHDYADSQFGHIFAHGATRDDARKSMVLALSELEIRGEIRTAIEFLKSVLENDEYIAGKIDTVWLERNMAKLPIMIPSHLTAEKIVLLGAIATGHKSLTEIDANLLEALNMGRNVNRRDFEDKIVSCHIQLIYQNIKYLIQIERTSPDSYTLRQEGSNWSVDIILRELSDQGLLVSMDGRTHTLYATWNSAGQLVLAADGHTVVFEQEYDPSNIRAEMPGKLVRLLVTNGSHVDKTQPFAEIEVMKMYMPLLAPEAGMIDFTAQVGSILQIGQKIATLKLDDPSQVKTAVLYEDTFPPMDAPEAVPVKIDVKIAKSLQKVEYMLDGYIAATDKDGDYVRRRINEMMSALRDPRLPCDEFFTYLDPLRGRIDEDLYERLYEIASEYRRNLTLNRLPWEAASRFPSGKIISTIDVFRHNLQSASDRATFDGVIAPLKEITNIHRSGTHHYAVKIVIDLLEKFLSTERQFVDKNETIVIQNLRRETPDNLGLVCNVVRAHFQLKHREKLVMELLNIVENIFHKKMFQFISTLTPILEEMTTLTGIEYGRIHLKSRAILLSLQVPSESQRRMEIENMLASHVPMSMSSNVSSGHLSGLGRSSSDPSSLVTPQTPSEPAALQSSARGAGAEGIAARSNSMMMSVRRGGDLKEERELLNQLPDILEILPQYMASPEQNKSSNAVELWVRSVFSPPFYFLNKRSVSVDWEPFVSTSCAFDYSTKSLSEDLSAANGSGSSPISSVASSSVLNMKRGYFGFYHSLSKLKQNFDKIFNSFSTKNALPLNVIILAFPHDLPFSERSFIQEMERFLQKYHKSLKQCGISFLSFLVHLPEGSPPLFTFRQALDYKEDLITRHIMPPLVTMLEMDRLKNGFQIQWQPTENRRIHVFEAIPKQSYYSRASASNKRAASGTRLFVRVPVAQLVKPSTMLEDVLTNFYRFGGPEFALMEVIHALESLMSTQANRSRWQFNHVLLSCFFDVDLSGAVGQLGQFAKDSDEIGCNNKAWKKRLFTYLHNRIAHNYQIFNKALHSLHITHLECRIQVRVLREREQEPFVVRAFVDDPGSGAVNIHIYEEKKSRQDATIKLVDPGYFKVLGALHNTEAFAPHCVEYPLMHQRRLAMRLGTTYVYDWPTLFGQGLRAQWNEFRRQLGIGPDDEEAAAGVQNVSVEAGGAAAAASGADSGDAGNGSKGPGGAEDVKNAQKDQNDGTVSYLDVAARRFEDEEMFNFEELVLDESGSLVKTDRAPGENKLGMVAWRANMRTPQYPNGRDLYIVANDITSSLGTFGRVEDALYNAVCARAMKEGLPFIYLSANSGARIGMDENTRSRFKIAWTISDSGVGGMLNPELMMKPTKSRIQFAEDDVGADVADESGERAAAASDPEEAKEEAKMSEESGSSGANKSSAAAATSLRSPVAITQDARYEPDYLYLEPSDYEALRHLVTCEKVVAENGELRYKLVDVIGKEGIGVENLSGSGLIAGATSRAYFNTFTLSYVTGRSVGIGAYLVRLGQRIVQKTDSPILLTGYVALNNLLGRQVYISNLQIGGADEIMMPNGVAHRQVESDLEGALEILRWLSYVPERRGASVPVASIKTLADPIDRDIECFPDSTKYDPRSLVAGEYKAVTDSQGQLLLKKQDSGKADEEADGKGSVTTGIRSLGTGDDGVATTWISGLFDESSWCEYLPNWAKTVVTGRARLGGISVGVIASEPRTQTCVVPPDPANADSREQSFQQAGQVWYPDSSYKTAQAIKDFDGEGLPLFILANWRGFSGGQRDMFNEVLKYGSYIVDHLSSYRQPIFVYLPPTAELRGGAWVVLDKLINSKCIEMYAAKTSRANVLEPTGTIGLKYRKKELLKSMHRLDYTLIQLKKEEKRLVALKGGKDVSKQSKQSKQGKDSKLEEKDAQEDSNEKLLSQNRKEIENRERTLLPVYQRIALMFAELHDTPGRMKSVNVIDEVVPWRQARRFFYWRLRRRLLTNESVLSVVNAGREGTGVVTDVNEVGDEAWQRAEKQFVAWYEANAKEDQALGVIVEDAKDGKDVVKAGDEALGVGRIASVVGKDREFVESCARSREEFAKFVTGLKKERLEESFKRILREYPGDISELKSLLAQGAGDGADMVLID